MKITFLIYGFMLPILLLACASLPTQEMSDARQAIKAAHNANAEVYAPGGLLRAEQDLTQAEKELAQGQLHQAREYALSAKHRAVTAYEAAITLEQAKIIWKAIENLDHRTPLPPALKQAEAATLQGDVDNILKLATLALQQGYHTLNLVYLAQARILMDKLKAQSRTLYPGETTILELAQQAYDKKQGKQALNLIRSLSITQ